MAVSTWVRHPGQGIGSTYRRGGCSGMELRILSKMFSVVELRGFDGRMISGITGGVRS